MKAFHPPVYHQFLFLVIFGSAVLFSALLNCLCHVSHIGDMSMFVSCVHLQSNYNILQSPGIQEYSVPVGIFCNKRSLLCLLCLQFVLI